jgi:hypothetical protein
MSSQGFNFFFFCAELGRSGICPPTLTEFFAMDDLVLNVASIPEPPSGVLALIAAGAVSLFATLSTRSGTRR